MFVNLQIGLVDVLHSVGIKPDYLIGHSVGELGCAYADGCLTAEQMILSAYSIGLAFTETKVDHGSMAIIGLGYSELKDICPSDIEIACRNSASSAIISGPETSVKTFAAKLQVWECILIFDDGKDFKFETDFSPMSMPDTLNPDKCIHFQYNFSI